MFEIKYSLINTNARCPQKAHDDDAGFDLFSVDNIIIQSQDFACISTGVCIELPKGTEAQIRPRSGLAAKYGITVLNSPGTIDAGYRGELKVVLVNHSKSSFEITPGMRIAQLVIKPIYEARFSEAVEFSDSTRGNGGFGSTG